MFGQRNYACIPEEFITNHEAWERYMAGIWHRFLKEYDLGTHDIIIEVAPGLSSKIGLALEQAGFEGTVYLIDPLESSLEAITEKYKKYMPRASIIPIKQSLFTALSSLPRRPDFVLANHPLDDMLMASLSDFVVPELFDCSSSMHRYFRQQLERESKPSIVSVIDCWQSFMGEISPKTTILSQYPSLIQKQNDLHTINTYSSEILDALKLHYQEAIESPLKVQLLLNEHENYNDAHIGTAVLNAEHWMILSNQL